MSLPPINEMSAMDQCSRRKPSRSKHRHEASRALDAMDLLTVQLQSTEASLQCDILPELTELQNQLSEWNFCPHSTNQLEARYKAVVRAYEKEYRKYLLLSQQIYELQSNVERQWQTNQSVLLQITRVPAVEPGITQLYVGDLAVDVTETKLYPIFNRLGLVASIHVCRNHMTRGSLGGAYVNFYNAQDAIRALDEVSSIRGLRCSMMISKLPWTRGHEAPRANCVECGAMLDADDIFISSNCCHVYCFRCASNIINNSLSLLNELPRCGLFQCDKVLNIAHCPRINDVLLEKYQTHQRDLKVYRHDQCLLRGFINEAVGDCTQLFPRDLVELIHDFFKLVYFSARECDACDSTGTAYQECTHCLADCKHCGGTGSTVSKARCDACFGSVRIDCVICDGSGVLQRPCGMKNVCYACDGLRGSECIRCVNGIIANVDPCKPCRGQGIERGGVRKAECAECAGTGVVATPCNSCSLLSGVMYTDFAKLVQKQAMCQKCSQFSPRHLMASWGACGHLFCVPCLVQSHFITLELEQLHIPICPAKDCEHELTLEDFAMIYGNGHKHLSPAAYNQYYHLLSTVHWTKGKFCCRWCSEWHQEADAQTLPTCGHTYVASCAKPRLQSSMDVEHLPRCGQCYAALKRVDVEAVCDKQYAHIFDALSYYHAMAHKVIVGAAVMSDLDRVLSEELTVHNTISRGQQRDMRRLLEFLQLLRVKADEVRYLKLLFSDCHDSRGVLFRVCVADMEVARRVVADSATVLPAHDSSVNGRWTVGLCEAINAASVSAQPAMMIRDDAVIHARPLHYQPTTWTMIQHHGVWHHSAQQGQYY